ncbi:MAG: GlxA family transcriptional regulator [Rhodospirillaceae bacterium]|nr:GlxA family transcriptional regulator [Rhodospirillaceae bacterium]MBT5242764.1 GlxA family transcriptional regulator [Rhodospirillaceae bacterium]MBT6241825.1 GlxA family transcriptional regulator [Rhodospirillaceae bacterium]MBT7138626.1 GlxA family transcriptional regulator [Rhodospirillaceae bacterium]
MPTRLRFDTFFDNMIPLSTNNLTEHLGFLLLPKFSSLCLANALEPLRATNLIAGRPLYRWSLYSPDGEDVVSSSGITTGPIKPLNEARDVDALFVVSSYDYRRQISKPLLRDLVSLSRHIPTLGGLDTGSFVLAEAGLLDGYHATIHWQELAIFEEAFHDVSPVSDRFVIDRNRITAGGATTTLDLMLHLIRASNGEALRLEVAALFIYDGTHVAEEPQRPPPPIDSLPFPADMGPVIALMETNIEAPLKIGEIARRLGLSQKKLERRVRRILNTTPVAYYQHIRLSAARSMALETVMPISEIAVRTGFSSASALTRAFARHFSITPSDLRRRALL